MKTYKNISGVIKGDIEGYLKVFQFAESPLRQWRLFEKYLKGKSYKPRTINRHFSSFNNYMREVFGERAILFRSLKRPIDPPPEYLSKKDFEKIRSYCSARDSVILGMLYIFGYKISEIYARNLKGNRMTTRSIRRIVNEAGKKIGIKLSPTILRRGDPNEVKGNNIIILKGKK